MAENARRAGRRPPRRYRYGKDATAILDDGRVGCVISEISVVDATLRCATRPRIGTPMLLAVPEIGALEALVVGRLVDGFAVTFDIAEAVRRPLAGDLARLSALRVVN